VIYKRRELKDGFLSFCIDCYEKNEKGRGYYYMRGKTNARKNVKVDRLVMCFFSFFLLSFFLSRKILIHYNLIINNNNFYFILFYLFVLCLELAFENARAC
jgi:hypothetical protein